MSIQLTQEKSLRRSMIAVALFIVVISLCLAIFFVGLFADVEHAVERELWGAMMRQSRHVDSSFFIRFQHLETVADFLGKMEDIHGEAAQELLRSLGEKSSMRHVGIYDTDGNAIFENGDCFENVDAAYIRKALRGQRNVSDPNQSLLDGATRFYLSVPIYRGEEVVGVLSGSFDVDQLGPLLIEDNYEGQSVLFVTDLSGRVIYADQPEDPEALRIPKELYAQLYQATFLDGGSASELISLFRQHETGIAQYRQSTGEDLFLLYAPIANSNLMLMHAIPNRVAYGDFSVIERHVIYVGLALLGCVVLLVIALLVSSSHSQRDLARYAQTDPLTGLFNKQHTQEAVDLWLNHEARTGIQAMLFIDIDYFKQINDTYGHAVGDEALRFVGRALEKEFRRSDIIGRVGGDEFVVCMRNVPVKHVVRLHAASLSKRLKSAEIPGLDQGVLHCSIGIAYAPEHGNSYRELSRYADEALYQTKERGRDGFSEYGETSRQEEEDMRSRS